MLKPGLLGRRLSPQEPSDPNPGRHAFYFGLHTGCRCPLDTLHCQYGPPTTLSKRDPTRLLHFPESHLFTPTTRLLFMLFLQLGISFPHPAQS